MEPTSVSFAPKLVSGIDPIDQEWGGLYRGGSYLIYGRATSGRGLLTLMFTKMGVARNESCLFISPGRPKDLMIQAASIGFDLRQAHADGLVKLLRIPPLLNLQNQGDEGVAKALRDLAAIIRQHRPDRLVINDFMPFVVFQSMDRFWAEFLQLLEQIDPLEMTMLLLMAEPANQLSHRVIDFMSSQTTGTFHIELTRAGEASTERRLTLIPNIGHIKQHVIDDWDLDEIVERGLPISSSLHLLPGDGPQEPLPPTLPAPSKPAPSPEPPALPQDTAPPPSPDPAARPVHTSIVPPASPASPPPLKDREAFQQHLQKYFEQRETGEAPFLLLAMRADPSKARLAQAFDFDFILEMVHDTLRPKDHMLLNRTRERLVVLLEQSRPEDAQKFFARLKSRLRETVPNDADELLHAVSAIVVPDGRPFQNAREFLTYALDAPSS